MERHPVDMLLVSKTCRTPAKKINLPNCNAFRADLEDGTIGGGEAIFYKRTIDYMPTPASALGRLETIFIVLCHHNGPIKVVVT